MHCIGLSLLAKLIPVGSLAGVADPGLAIARLSLVWRLLVPGSSVGSQGDFLQSLCGEDAWPTGWRSWDLGLVTGALGPRSVFDLVTGGASS